MRPTRPCHSVNTTCTTFGGARRNFHRFRMGLGPSKRALSSSMSIFDHSVKQMDGSDFALSSLKGQFKAFMVVNLASK
jgi:hypothetical protein